MPTTSTVAPEQVNFANYEAGVLAFADCLAEAGHPLLDLEQRADEPRLYDYIIPWAAVDSGDEDRCYNRHLLAIDMSWQLLLEEERRANPETDPEYQTFLACSQRLRRPVSTQGSLTDILHDFENIGVDISTCFQQIDAPD